MDQFLYNYLLSGKAWLFIGSGPSIEMGYPTWGKLASISIEMIKEEGFKADFPLLNTFLTNRNYPRVFTEAKKILGDQRLRQILRDNLKPNKKSSIYPILAQWPISVYMTTNYDDELQKHLASLGLAYSQLTNSDDHLSLLIPDFSNAVVKLHGDLSEERGLILTEENYQQIAEAASWEYWRTKMAAIFQMNRIIVVGYSLSDMNVRHVLEASRKGTGVTQPIVWIAPNVPTAQRNSLLTDYRIRIISYDDRDDQHRNLVKLLQSINEAVPPRTIVKIKEEIERASRPPEPNVAAAGFFVFNEFCGRQDFDEKRIDIVVSAIQASLPELAKVPKFSSEFALETCGWPKTIKIDPAFQSKIVSRALIRGLFVQEGEQFRVDDQAVKNASNKRVAFEQMRSLFIGSLGLRIKRDFPELINKQVDTLSIDIESSLIRYFREGGLSLASVLFSKGQERRIPGSLFTFIASASTRYDDLTMRLAFFKTTIDCFLHAETPEINYLGRLSQGFFAFHGLGVFGGEAAERLNLAKETVWLVDSDTQIRMLALGCYGNLLFRDCVKRLKNLGLRFFTNNSLLYETRVHLWFADNVIKQHGQNSTDIIASANGETPYRKLNLFMEGFIKWQAAGNPCNWQSYLYSIFQQRDYDEVVLEKTLGDLGIEVVELEAWPGFSEKDFAETEEYTKQIVDRLQGYMETENDDETDFDSTAYKKAKPEAEAFNIIKKERNGIYHIIAENGKGHSAWFISHTSMLNLLERNVIITWQPEAFLSFASTICDLSNADSAKQAFDRIVLGIAQSGMQLLDDATIGRVFGGVIEQAKLDMEGLRREYEEILQRKYGESIDSVMARVPPRYFSIAVTQIASEVAQGEADRRKASEARSLLKDEKISQLEKQLKPLEKYKAKLAKRQGRKKKSKNKKH